MSCFTSGSAFSLIVIAAVVWGTQTITIPSFTPALRTTAATRSVTSIISDRLVVRTVSVVIAIPAVLSAPPGFPAAGARWSRGRAGVYTRTAGGRTGRRGPAAGRASAR